MTDVQTTIFGGEVTVAPAAPVAKPELTERQQFSLDTLRHAGRGGLTVDEVGAAWCARRGKHDADDRCAFCGSSGREVLRALRRKGKTKQRRDGTGTWVALDGLVEPEPAAGPAPVFERPDGTTGDIPF